LDLVWDGNGLKEANLIKVKTSRFGDIEVKQDDVISLPSGLIGFPELKEFVLLDHDKDSPFKWLQSLVDGTIAFVLINPLLFKSDYEVEVTEAEVAGLSLENEEDAVISVIVTMPTNPQQMTANLKAPLVFNLKNRLGKQIILTSNTYTPRHNIMEEMKNQNRSLKEAHAAAQTQEIKETVQSEEVKQDVAS
jgi:flagellar assembly factor FliW